MDLKKSKQIQCDFIYIFVTVTLQNNKQYLLTNNKNKTTMAEIYQPYR